MTKRSMYPFHSSVARRQRLTEGVSEAWCFKKLFELFDSIIIYGYVYSFWYCYVHKCPCGSACVFFLSLLLALSLFPVDLLGHLPWLLIGSWSCHSSLSDMTPTYPLPVKFPLADKSTLKGVNGDLFCSLFLLSFYSFLACFICYSFMPKSFVFCSDISWSL